MVTILRSSDRVQASNWILQEISTAAQKGVEGQILIVPEQFSHETERRLCQVGGPTISRYAEVLSLSRLADRVAASEGGAARKYLDKGGKLLAMALAAEQVSSRIGFFSAVLRKPVFLADMVRIVDEFRSYCLDPSALFSISRRTEGSFSKKLEELGLLYEAYLAVCANGSADPTDKLLSLSLMLAEGDWPSDRVFYLDGFSDFTGVEEQVLEALIRHGRSVTISAGTAEEGSLLRDPMIDTFTAVRNLTEKWGIRPYVRDLFACSERDAGITRLINGLFSSMQAEQEASSAIGLRSFETVEAECSNVVLEIKSLLRARVRCRDISVACTDLSVYEPLLRDYFDRAQLPAYFAGETSLLTKPVISFTVNSLAAAAGSMDYEDVSLYLKSGFLNLEQDRCDRLDNYAYRWNIRGSRWDGEWQLHPGGFGLDWSEEDRENLAQLNADRAVAMEPLLRLRKALQQALNTGEMAVALYAFLEWLQLRSRLEAQAETAMAHGNGKQAQELAQIFEILCTSLEQLWLILGETIRTPEDFAQLYQLHLTQYKVGTIPAGLDQIHVSDLPDLRMSQTKYLFVLGASDGNFPPYQGAEGLLTEEERRTLLSYGIQLAPGRADQMDREMVRIHSALLSASEYLWISYAGEQPSWLFRKAAAQFPDSFRADHPKAFLDLPSYASWRVRQGETSPSPVFESEYLEHNLRKKTQFTFDPLREKQVEALYGRQYRLSASKLDEFAHCKLSYFLHYGLRAQPRKRAELNPAAFGDFVHAVLELTVRRVMELGGFPEVSEEELLEIALEEIKRYVEAYIPEQGEREAYLLTRSKREILAIVRDLGEELRSSQFQPIACELQFDRYNGELPSVLIEGERAVSEISGKVDRVDLFEQDGHAYVRVVDYKTGKKSFDYTDILNGVGLQMLIYLFALRQYGAEYLNTPPLEPAGVLYLPARQLFTWMKEPAPDDASIGKEKEKERRRKGLIRGDDALLRAMEADPEDPQFMPYKVSRGRTVGDLADHRQMILLERHVIRTLKDLTDQMSRGEIAPDPLVRGPYSPCNYCDYSTVCHKDLGLQKQRNMAETTAARFWEKLEEMEADHG